VSDADLRHATYNALDEVDLDPDGDPPKVVVIGPDTAGNVLEVIVLLLASTSASFVRPLRGLSPLGPIRCRSGLTAARTTCTTPKHRKRLRSRH
jgi:hypothetical protein